MSLWKEKIKPKINSIGKFMLYELIGNTERHDALTGLIKKIFKLQILIPLAIGFMIFTLAIKGIGSVPLWLVIIVFTVIVLVEIPPYKSGNHMGWYRKKYIGGWWGKRKIKKKGVQDANRTNPTSNDKEKGSELQREQTNPERNNTGKTIRLHTENADERTPPAT